MSDQYDPPPLLVTDEIKRRYDAILVRNGLPPLYATVETAAPGSTGWQEDRWLRDIEPD